MIMKGDGGRRSLLIFVVPVSDFSLFWFRSCCKRGRPSVEWFDQIVNIGYRLRGVDTLWRYEPLGDGKRELHVSKSRG
jgi:hypothetical protein